MKKTFLLLLFLKLSILNVFSTQFDLESYKSSSNLQHFWAEKILQLQHKDGIIPQGGIVGDGGCGDGIVTNRYVKPYTAAKKIFAFDKSESMVKGAQQSNKDQSIIFFKQSIEELNEKDKYNCFTCFSVLQWIEDKDLAIKNISNALLPNGLLSCLCAIYTEETCLNTARNNIIEKSKWKKNFENFKDPAHLVKPLEMQKLLSKYNLEQKRFISHPVKKEFSNDEDFYAWIFGWSQFKDLLLGIDHTAFWMECIAEYRKLTEQSLAPNDTVVFRDYVLEIAAIKKQ